MHGFLLIDKPLYWTSFDVVKYIRKICCLKSVGHTGSLDPIAQGLLIICVGRATKFVPVLMDKEKEYVVIIRLGVKTDTDDISGTIIEHHKFMALSDSYIKRVLQEFTGEIYQIPPMYSALKLNGSPLYKLARKGKVIDRPPRKVWIYEIKFLHYIQPLLALKVRCGKGTYIRALARDLGDRLGCGGCVKSLVRTRIGEFRLSQAVSPKSITTAKKAESLLL